MPRQERKIYLVWMVSSLHFSWIMIESQSNRGHWKESGIQMLWFAITWWQSHLLCLFFGLGYKMFLLMKLQQSPRKTERSWSITSLDSIVGTNGGIPALQKSTLQLSCNTTWNTMMAIQCIICTPSSARLFFCYWQWTHAFLRQPTRRAQLTRRSWKQSKKWLNWSEGHFNQLTMHQLIEVPPPTSSQQFNA